MSDTGGELSGADRAVLELAFEDGLGAGQMRNRIRQLGMSEIGYYQRLNVLLETEKALAAYPIQVRYLRSLREGRSRVILGVNG